MNHITTYGTGASQDSKKLVFSGKPDAIMEWIDHVDVIGSQVKYIGTHIATIRNGAYPECFQHNLHSLNKDTVLALPASKVSIWSAPIYGPAIPEGSITVKAYLRHIKSLKPAQAQKQAMDSDDDSSSDDSTPPAEQEVTTGNTSSAGGAMQEELYGIGPRKRKDVAEKAERDERKRTRTVIPTFGQRNADRCIDFNKNTEKAIIFLRGTLSISACNILDSLAEYRNAVASEDLLQVYNIIIQKALFGESNKAIFVEKLQKSIANDPKFKLATAGMSLSDFATRYVRAWQMLKYANAKLEEGYIVRAFVLNLPPTPRYANARRALATKYIDDATEAAKNDLGMAIDLITNEAVVYDDLHPDASEETTKTGGGSRLLPKQPQPDEPDLKTLILRMSANLDAVRNQPRATTHKREYGVEPCNRFPLGTCPHGDGCKYLHSTATKPDHRMKNGTMLPAFKISVAAFQKNYYAKLKEAGYTGRGTPSATVLRIANQSAARGKLPDDDSEAY